MMSMCTTIQGKGFTFIATDTAVSTEIEGKKYRVGFANKFHIINRDTGVFLSGKCKDIQYICNYIACMQEIDILKIHKFLLSKKNENRLTSRVGILIVQRDRIVAMDWDSDFKIGCNYNPTQDNVLDVQAFSEGGEIAKQKVKEIINKSKDITDSVIYGALLQGYKSISRPNVGGDLDIHMILSNAPIKKVIALKIDDIKPVQLKDVISIYHMNINDNFTVDRSGNCIAKSIKISGANSELDAKDMVVRNLVVGQNVFMGENAKLTWGNLPDDVAGVTDVPTDSKIKGLALNEVGAKLGITHTTIGKAFIESPEIRGGEISGAIFRQDANDARYAKCEIIGGRVQYHSGTTYIGSVMGDVSDGKMWIEGNKAIKLTTVGGGISLEPRGGLVHIGDCQFMGSVRGCTVVFG